jgi:hypothetical protein
MISTERRIYITQKEWTMLLVFKIAWSIKYIVVRHGHFWRYPPTPPTPLETGGVRSLMRGDAQREVAVELPRWRLARMPRQRPPQPTAEPRGRKAVATPWILSFRHSGGWRQVVSPVARVGVWPESFVLHRMAIQTPSQPKISKARKLCGE